MRIRTIKPDFWMHEGLGRCSEFARLLAIALLNLADDEGYFLANPAIIRGQVFPFVDSSSIIPGALAELSSVGFLALGSDSQGRAVGRVLNFQKHQKVDKPKPSSIKGNSTFADVSPTPPRNIPDASTEEWKGMEGKGNGGGREEESPPPLDFAPQKETNPNRMATFEQVTKFGRGQMPPVSEECMEGFFDRMEADGWINNQGFPLADWRPRFRTWATAWAANASGQRRAVR